MQEQDSNIESIINYIVCPLCKSKFEFKNNKLYCTYKQCNSIYPVENDIPILLIEEASHPCPNCGSERKWKAEESKLICEACNTEFNLHTQ